MITRRNFVIGSGVSLVLTACGGQGSGSGGGGKTLKIAVVPKGTTHEFWKAVHAGAVKASKELGVEIVWKGPLKEDDLKQQIEVVQSFVAQGVSGIVLAPLNDKGLVPAVNEAKQANIPVVIFDSDLQGDAYTSFVATDNVAAGKLAGERMGKLLGGKGKVMVLRYQEGSASTQLREKGFLEAVKGMSEIQVVSDNQYGGATTESAFAASENLLVSLKAAEGGVNGIFCPNESTTFGMLLALEKSGLAGKVKFVGFDASDKLVDGLNAGKIDGLVLQNPFRMGELAVQTMTKHLKGEKVDKRIDTGARVVDKESMNDPEVKALLKPDLTKWLGQ
ncbi:MAG: substrate-binding domain-containing protein [Polyangiaceae bacterium]|nr:substrate-binding domain-containing protein [Polyangiaceae bacterium]